MLHELINAIEDTLFMVFASSFIMVIVAFPLSLLQALPHANSKRLAKYFYQCLDGGIHLVCTMPYIVMLVILIPLSKWLIHVNQNHFFAIIPMSIVAIPLFIKVCVESFKRIPNGLLDTFLSLGANRKQIIFKALIPETLPHIIYGFSQILIQLLTFAVILGILGAEGLGKLLLLKGFHHYQSIYVLPIIASLILIVLTIQIAGRFLAFGELKQNLKH